MSDPPSVQPPPVGGAGRRRSRRARAIAFGAPMTRHDPHLENCRASTSILYVRGSPRTNEQFCSFQATKSQRWMPWRQEPMKDVSDCEKLRGAVY